MASMVGSYKNEVTGEILKVTKADDSNGTMAGTLQVPMNGSSVTVDVTGHYHFINSTGPGTNLVFSGAKDDPNLYESWAASTDASTYKELRAAGGRSVSSGATTSVSVLYGSFIRQ